MRRYTMPSLEEYTKMLENLKNNLEGVDTMAKKNIQEEVVNTEKAVQEEKKVEEIVEKKMNEQEEKKVVMIMLTKEELEKMLDNLEYRLYKGLAKKLNKIAKEIKETKKD